MFFRQKKAEKHTCLQGSFGAVSPSYGRVDGFLMIRGCKPSYGMRELDEITITRISHDNKGRQLRSEVPACCRQAMPAFYLHIILILKDLQK